MIHRILSLFTRPLILADHHRATSRLEAYRVANLEEQARRLSRSKAGRGRK